MLLVLLIIYACYSVKPACERRVHIPMEYFSSSAVLPTPPAATSSAGHKLTGSQATPVMSPTAKTAANQGIVVVSITMHTSIMMCVGVCVSKPMLLGYNLHATLFLPHVWVD